MNRWKGIAPILAGRWQIPLLICAIMVAGAALYLMKPPKRAVPFEALLADVLALAEGGAYFDAADAAANLLELDPPLPRGAQATLHNTLAEIIYRQELLRGLPNRTNAALLLRHHEAALTCGYTPDGQTAVRAAGAHEWLGETQQAINIYRAVAERESATDGRRAALQGLVRLLDGQANAADERRGYIQTLLDEEGVAADYLWWALQHAVREALDHDEVARARELLTQHGQRFKRSDLKGYYDYLCASVNVCAGRTDLAWPLIDRVDQWLAENTPTDTEMDQAGFLPAMSRWLRGRIHLAEGRPQAALAAFEQASALQSHGDLLVMTTVGRAEALGLLERHATARAVVRDAVARLEGDPAALSTGRARLRQAVLQLLHKRHEEQDYEHAVACLELALALTPPDEPELRRELLERLGLENAEAAKLAADADERRMWHRDAARAYEQAADLAQLDEPRYASLLWASAAQCDLAGRSADVRLLLLRFVEGRTLDPRMPQALLQLGQAYAAGGQLEQAIKHYRQLIEGYPLLEEAWRARLLTANCLTALGTEYHAEAQAILLDLLEDEHVAPHAPVFRDALFELCDLFYQRQEYAQAISHMEDFLAFYPEDAERYRVRFALADAYRRSAHALAEDASGAAQGARQRASRERFQRAAELFAAFSTDIVDAAGVDEGRSMYERLALFYRGDCLFALNEPVTLAEALATYRQAAARYQGEPVALTAQVQIANIHLRQGKITEAARAVERARWLLGNIPDGAFAEYEDGRDRAAWERFLNTVRSSHLFGDVLAGAQ